MDFLVTYARGTLMTPRHDQRYSSMASIIPAISDLLIFGSPLGSLYSSSSFFCPAMMCIVSSCTPVISQSKVHLHLWWSRKVASFRFSWALTETCCPLSGIPLAFLPPGFLTILQMSSTFLSVRALSLSGLSHPCFLTSNLAALGLNSSQMYISWSHETIISGPYSFCTHWFPFIILQGIILWQRVPSLDKFMFAYSAWGSSSFSSGAAGSFSGSYPS